MKVLRLLNNAQKHSDITGFCCWDMHEMWVLMHAHRHADITVFVLLRQACNAVFEARAKTYRYHCLTSQTVLQAGRKCLKTQRHCFYDRQVLMLEIKRLINEVILHTLTGEQWMECCFKSSPVWSSQHIAAYLNPGYFYTEQPEFSGRTFSTS